MKTIFAGMAIGLLASCSAPKGVNVAEFGAVPDDGLDDTEAFLAAFQAVEAEGAARLNIPPGRYHLRADGNPRHRGMLFPVEKIDGLTIRGKGAELMMTGNAGIFSFNECANITVEGFTVDWDRPAFSQGTVLAATLRQFDIKIEDDFPVQGGEPVGAFMSYDPETRLPDGKTMDVYGSVARTELLEPQVLRVHLERDIPVKPGMLLVLRHQVYGPGVFRFHRCSNIHVRDVTVHTCPGMALVGGITTGISLERFNVLLRPGSRHLMSATADATHFGGCKGTVSLKDCTFEGMGDDGVNVKSGLYLTVLERAGDRAVLCRHNLKMHDVPDPGDVLELSHPETLLPFATGVVDVATLDKAAENLHRVTFTEPLPADLRPGDLLGNSSRAPRLRIRNCTVRANRARGVLCQTRDAVIENCTFRHCTGPGVLVLTEITHFHESIGTRDVTVRGCVFDNCSRGAATAEAPLAALAWLKKFSYPPRPGVHRNVTLENNRITGTANSAIFAAGVDGLVIRGNRITRACLQPTKPNGRHAIHVQASSRVVLAGNDIDPQQQGAAMELPVMVEEPSGPPQ
jgi:hypothetical protein